MVLTKSNKLGDDIYKKEVFYIDTKSLTYSLYDETSEFRSFLSRDLSRKIVDGLDSLLDNGNGTSVGKRRRKSGPNAAGLISQNRKLRKPVISFFSDKARVIREEMERLEAYVKKRREIHRNVVKSMREDVEMLKRFLKEIALYAPGTRHSIDIRRLDLEREMLALRKEMRVAELSLFRDILFLRNTQREMVFEYQALKRMAELVENGGKDGLFK